MLVVRVWSDESLGIQYSMSSIYTCQAAQTPDFVRNKEDSNEKEARSYNSIILMLLSEKGV